MQSLIFVLQLVQSLKYFIQGTSVLAQTASNTLLGDQHLCIVNHYKTQQISGKISVTVYKGWSIQERGVALKLQISQIKKESGMLVIESKRAPELPNFISKVRLVNTSELKLLEEKDYGQFILTNSLLNFKISSMMYVSPVCKEINSGPLTPDYLQEPVFYLYECKDYKDTLKNQAHLRDFVQSGMCVLSASKQSSNAYLGQVHIWFAVLSVGLWIL